MRSNACITLTVASNATGTHDLLSYFIGVLKKPHCFDLASLSEKRKIEETYANKNMGRWRWVRMLHKILAR